MKKLLVLGVTYLPCILAARFPKSCSLAALVSTSDVTALNLGCD